jgi:hypothetical protein
MAYVFTFAQHSCLPVGLPDLAGWNVPGANQDKIMLYHGCTVPTFSALPLPVA